MNNFCYYSMALHKEIESQKNTRCRNMPLIEDYSKRASKYGRKARDLSNKLGIALEEGFTNTLSAVETIYNSCITYHNQAKFNKIVMQN